MKGRVGVQIDAVNLQTGAVSSTQTWGSGGYELALAPGQYRLIASLNDTVVQTTNVTVNNVNIEQDFVLTNSWQGGTRAGRHRRGPAVGCSARDDPRNSAVRRHGGTHDGADKLAAVTCLDDYAECF